ncbi:response regulator transcription factor [Acetobacteraceae bacterium ESL0709]|nr:response regulator transcription factor [Acetobacteraceae bacterium ESL0697]MDF7677603.1 response regulator transcription factor [Acetobacteraceae bacterium ESL0709]
MRILIAESDLSTATPLIKTLKGAAYAVDHVKTGEDALDMMRHYDFDLLITELNLSDIDAPELIRQTRRAHMKVPIMVISSIDRSQVKVKAFSMGADDYLVKPFDTDEIIARCRALVRRSRGYADSLLRIGELELNLESRIVNINGKPLHLTGKEYSILELLVVRKNTVLAKDTFLNHLYGGIDEPEMKIIDVFICKLRRKLQNYGLGNLISTVWGRGYIMRDASESSENAPTGPDTEGNESEQNAPNPHISEE